MAASHLATSVAEPIGIGRGSGVEVGVIIDGRSSLELSTRATGGRCATVEVSGELDLADADLFALFNPTELDEALTLADDCGGAHRGD